MAERFAHCLFCDDVRAEVGNKMSLMGIYGSELSIVGSVPLALPKLVIAVWLCSDIDDVPTKFVVKAQGADGNDLFSIAGEIGSGAVPPENAKRAMFTAVIPMSPFIVTQEGVIEVTVETEKDMLLAGRLHLKILPPPAESVTAHGLPAVKS